MPKQKSTPDEQPPIKLSDMTFHGAAPTFRIIEDRSLENDPEYIKARAEMWEAKARWEAAKEESRLFNIIPPWLIAVAAMLFVAALTILSIQWITE